MSEIYDVIILGAGPAGLAAGLYAGRSRLNVLIIEKGQDGGQIAITDEIENYPGQIVEGESGPSLIARMTEQAEKFGAKRVSDMIKEVELEGEVKVLKSEKNEYRGKNVIIATGAHARPIGCKGEQEYKGRGISYCATCDANFFYRSGSLCSRRRGCGSGRSTVSYKICQKSYDHSQKGRAACSKVYSGKAFANPKIAFLWDSVVEEVGGDGLLQTMTVKNVKTGELIKIEADPKDGLFGLFGFIGMIPNTGVFADKVETDDKGYIKTDEDMHTNVPGVYAAGDVRVKSLRQVVTAVADGAIAAVQVERSMSDY